MLPAKITLLFGFATLLKSSTAAPDSAGMVEMENGLAYGGIPYGSVSGMVAKYPGYGINTQLQARQFDILRSGLVQQLIFTTPSFRNKRSEEFRSRSVKINNLSTVISPAVIGLIFGESSDY